jgi:8-oxo-dGTP diphosphatase
MAEPRKHTEVAVGILLRADGAMLLSTRPPGKPYAGYWEFPGGKLEAGETVEQALRRDLKKSWASPLAPPASGR